MKRKIILSIFLILLTFNLVFALSLKDVSLASSLKNFFSNIFSRFFGSTVTPVTISCNDCNVGSCPCSITSCQSGILSVYNNPNNPGCVFTPTYSFTFSNGQKTWQPESSGTHYLKVLCDDGTKSSCAEVTVGGATTPGTSTTTVQPTTPSITTTTQPPSTTTTTIQSDFEVSSITCDERECIIYITRNPIAEDLVIFFELADNNGRIYYSSNLNLVSRVTGEKKLIISRLRTCPGGTRLELLALTYRQSDLNARVYRISDESFVC